MNGVVLLAAPNARAQYYAQALAAAGLNLRGAVLMGDAARHGESRAEGPKPWQGASLFFADLRIPLAATCAQISGEVVHTQALSVNSPEVVSALASLKPALVVYAGFGGQIVGQEVLGLGVPLLHMHAGRLPEFRGSTTIYYSMLLEGACAVSAILLSAGIDLGPIVARRAYPAPPPGVDVDKCYDNAIRADLLVRCLRQWLRTGRLDGEAQTPGAGRTYYIIHPVLKRIALDSLSTHPTRAASPDEGR